ncbi:MAG TPA: hypothetical protein DFS52_31870 [Myxococcales bacterium]|nr:hypothetical protein [Myxococcales bacterium]
MRLFAAICLLLTLGSLAVAAYTPPPFWYFGLYAAPLFGALFAVGLVVCAIEFLVGPLVRSIAPILGAALCVFAGLYTLFEGPPGLLRTEPLMLRALSDNGLSVAALGAAIGAVLLAAQGLRAPSIIVQGLAVADLIVAALVLGTIPRTLGLPSVSPWLFGVLAAGAGLYVVSAGSARVSPSDDGEAGLPAGSEEAAGTETGSEVAGAARSESPARFEERTEPSSTDDQDATSLGEQK